MDKKKNMVLFFHFGNMHRLVYYLKVKPALFVATIKASDTLEHQPTVWPLPYAGTQPYHPGQ